VMHFFMEPIRHAKRHFHKLAAYFIRMAALIRSHDAVLSVMTQSFPSIDQPTSS
jgi:hypothetical protein